MDIFSPKFDIEELLGFWTLSIVQYSKKQERTQRFENWICFRPQAEGETHTLLGPLERPNLNHLRSLVFFGIPHNGQSPKTQ
jgi:hypothetical protein